MSELSEAELEDLRQRIAQHGLDALKDIILDNVTRCYALVTAGPGDGAILGTTRFGGVPDLPPDYDWPCDGDPDDPSTRFSNFVGQVNFAEIAATRGSALPHQGACGQIV